MTQDEGRRHTTQVGLAQVLNVWLGIALAVAVVVIVAMASVGVHLAQAVQAQPAPLVFRVDSVGRMQPVQYGASGTLNPDQLQQVFRRDLSAFVRGYFGRRRATIHQDYPAALLFLSRDLEAATRRVEDKDHVVKQFLSTGNLDDVAIDVLNVKFRELTEVPYRADVDFARVTLDRQWREQKRELFTADLAFRMMADVPADYVEVNPLGLEVIQIVESQVF